MDVRAAEASDSEAIARVVRRSLQASYALSPQVIDEIVEEYDGDAIAERLAGGDAGDGGQVYLVAEDGAGDEVVGIAQGRIAADGVGEVTWLHVAPGGRGAGAGTALFERLREDLDERGATGVRAIVLSDNQEGEEFFERFALRERAETEVERVGVEFSAHVYADDEAAVDEGSMTRVDDGPGRPSEPADVPDSVADEGRTVYLAGEDPIPGSEGPFLRTFDDDAREQHYGYYCTNCGSTETAMDELERLECADCGNVHRADEWDAAYL